MYSRLHVFAALSSAFMLKFMVESLAVKRMIEDCRVSDTAKMTLSDVHNVPLHVLETASLKMG